MPSFPHSDSIAAKEPCPFCGGELLRGYLKLTVTGDNSSGEVTYVWRDPGDPGRGSEWGKPVRVLRKGGKRDALRCKSCRSVLLRQREAPTFKKKQ